MKNGEVKAARTLTVEVPNEDGKTYKFELVDDAVRITPPLEFALQPKPVKLDHLERALSELRGGVV